MLNPMLLRRRLALPTLPLQSIKLLILAAFSLFAFVLIRVYMPPDLNWPSFYGAGRAVLASQNPYAVNGFFNPPWSLALFVPLALLPEWLGHAFLMLLSVGGFIYAAYTHSRSPVAVLAFVLSIPVLQDLQEVNVDGLVLLGLCLPIRYGLFLILLKPQMGVAIALFWLVESWQRGGGRAVVMDFAPISATVALSLLIFGNWMQGSGSLSSATWNFSFFPFSLAIGLPLLYQSLSSRDIRYALPASPCLAPYVGLPSWSVALFALLQNERMTVLASAGTWIAFVVQLLTQR